MDDNPFFDPEGDCPNHKDWKHIYVYKSTMKCVHCLKLNPLNPQALARNAGTVPVASTTPDQSDEETETIDLTAETPTPKVHQRGSFKPNLPSESTGSSSQELLIKQSPSRKPRGISHGVTSPFKSSQSFPNMSFSGVVKDAYTSSIRQDPSAKILKLKKPGGQDFAAPQVTNDLKVTLCNKVQVGSKITYQMHERSLTIPLNRERYSLGSLRSGIMNHIRNDFKRRTWIDWLPKDWDLNDDDWDFAITQPKGTDITYMRQREITEEWEEYDTFDFFENQWKFPVVANIHSKKQNFWTVWMVWQGDTEEIDLDAETSRASVTQEQLNNVEDQLENAEEMIRMMKKQQKETSAEIFSLKKENKDLKRTVSQTLKKRRGTEKGDGEESGIEKKVKTEGSRSRKPAAPLLSAKKPIKLPHSPKSRLSTGGEPNSTSSPSTKLVRSQIKPRVGGIFTRMQASLITPLKEGDSIGSSVDQRIKDRDTQTRGTIRFEAAASENRTAEDTAEEVENAADETPEMAV